ncbi:hypothetical protein VZT92_011066 [Zoarces viviparus]|uniref:Uncharacterized protein n=1 Tax=Zoarces viviparus TaxID=48416 RepID=A0AAW1FAU0_ZOAVI
MATVNGLPISIECVDNAEGFPRVIIYGDETFVISYQQGAAFGAGHGANSSVRPFQSPHHEDEETAMEWDPPDSN